MNTKLSILTALAAAALCACATDKPQPGSNSQTTGKPQTQGKPRPFFNGTVVFSGPGNSIPTPGVTMAVEVKLASDSQPVAATWKIDNNPTAYPMGHVLNGVSCTNHTVRFYPPSGHTGPGPANVPGNASYDEKRHLILVKYQ